MLQASLTHRAASDFHAQLDRDPPALELVHRLDFSGVCPACEEVAHLRFDFELVLVDAHDTIGSKLAHTCLSCRSTTTRSFTARPDLTDADICTVLELRPVSS